MNNSELARTIFQRSEGKSRFIVAIAGPPGAGKSTLAEILVNELNQIDVKCSVVPMDGFHLDNVLLDADASRDRKGSPMTFDALGFVHLIKRLSAHEEEVIVPVFNREEDKAIAGVQRIALTDQIILVEGNYLLLNEAPWSSLHELWDFTIFINPGIEVLEERLVERWEHHGHDATAARQRAMHNDIPNAHQVVEQSISADADLSNTV